VRLWSFSTVARFVTEPVGVADRTGFESVGDVGSKVPVDLARQPLTAKRFSYAGRCAAIAALALVISNRGLETAIANGDTRTLTMHHIHTDEDITITYKRDGKYDEEALKKLDWFVRDWREGESTHMDPALYDLVWEASRQVGSDQPVYVVCGYRSPKTNAMLRRRSSGVAQHSQHMLGKAMDFFIPGAAIEDIRAAGLRLERGGVGYYPHSGAPFVHLDVGPVRHWGPAVQMARTIPTGRIGHTVHDAAAAAPYLSKHRAAADDDEDDADAANAHLAPVAAAPAAPPPATPTQRTAAARRSNTGNTSTANAAPSTGGFSLASAESRPATLSPVRQPRAMAQQPLQQTASLAEVDPPAPEAAPAQPERKDWAYATETPRPPESVKVPAPLVADGDSTAATPWTTRTVDKDRVPLDMVMAYAAPPQRDQDPASAVRPEIATETPLRTVPARNVVLRDPPARDSGQIRDNVTTVTKKVFARPVPDPIVRTRPAFVANAGMRYDDPWLRAMIVTPSLSSGMTAALYGDRDFSELRALMAKPTSTIVMSFGDEAYPGIAANRFSGEAVVFLSTRAFDQRRTASLH
jgi:uncharacterized protein YcbK (DUF882 family)